MTQGRINSESRQLCRDVRGMFYKEVTEDHIKYHGSCYSLGWVV
jgi:hypothetical protein